MVSYDTYKTVYPSYLQSQNHAFACFLSADGFRSGSYLYAPGLRNKLATAPGAIQRNEKISSINSVLTGMRVLECVMLESAAISAVSTNVAHIG